MIEYLFILGAGPFAREIEDYFKRSFPSAKISLVSDFGEERAIGSEQYQKIVQKRDDACATYIGSGKMLIRQEMMQQVKGVLGPPLLLSKAVWTDQIGKGTIIADNAVIAPRVNIGESVLVNYGATIGHDTTIAKLSAIGPQAAVGGFCRIEEAVYIGAGALIRECLSIGHDSTIGMGAIVTKDVPPNSLVTGVNQVSPQPEERHW